MALILFLRTLLLFFISVWFLSNGNKWYVPLRIFAMPFPNLLTKLISVKDHSLNYCLQPYKKRKGRKNRNFLIISNKLLIAIG